VIRSGIATAVPAVLSSIHASGVSKHPNVVLITIDTLRADHVHHLGCPRETTPRIDRLAAKGALFEQCISTSSWTLPAHMSLFTGRNAPFHGATAFNTRCYGNVPNLAASFQREGYKTAAFVSNAFLKARYGFARGFDLYDDYTIEMQCRLDLFGEGGKRGELSRMVVSEFVNEVALHWLRKNYKSGFFMFLHYFDPHYDYIPPKPYDTMFDPDYRGKIDGTGIATDRKIVPGMDKADLRHIIALYDGEIRHVDHCIGGVLDELERLGIAGNTIVVITSDHGDEFLEHGRCRHGQTLFDEVVRVPLIFTGPGIPAGTRIDALVSMVDIMPTLSDLLKVPCPGDVDGKSLAPLVLGDVGEARSEALCHLGIEEETWSLRSKTAKAVFYPRLNRTDYYDLKADPGEHRPLPAPPRGLEGAESKLLRWVGRHVELSRKRRRERELRMSPETLARLKGLGYVR